MSGILKGDSIYKSGGGGGGYKDGGQLVDGDFIEVKNNTISTYDNESRDPVNFYFEVKEGELINSIIEFTTQVNAVVNVYVVRNGIYYLLGNVGGNTVNASKIYTINVVNESFAIDEVSDEPTPDYVEIGDKLYGCRKIGNLYWTTSHCQATASQLGTSGLYVKDPQDPIYKGNFYTGFNTKRYHQVNEKIYPFRLPKKSDLGDLKTVALNNVDNIVKTGFSGFPNATNNVKFDAIPCGNYNFNWGKSFVGSRLSILFFDPNAYDELISYSIGVSDWSSGSNLGVTFPSSIDYTAGNLRFCMDI
jgi:hypothetical protein